MAVVKEVNYCSSIIALSKGNGEFEIRRLPARGQLSSVNSILCTDVNGDGLIDVITGGNKSGFPPQLQKLDASFGDAGVIGLRVSRCGRQCERKREQGDA